MKQEEKKRLRLPGWGAFVVTLGLVMMIMSGLAQTTALFEKMDNLQWLGTIAAVYMIVMVLIVLYMNLKRDKRSGPE